MTLTLNNALNNDLSRASNPQPTLPNPAKILANIQRESLAHDATTTQQALADANSKSAQLTNKWITAHFEGRAKRSTPQNAPPSSESTFASSQRERSQIEQDYEHLINLDLPSSIFPICTNAVEGAPNPPVPSGYQSWEGFLASDGDNSEIKNPQQELRKTLKSRLANFMLAQLNSPSMQNHATAFQASLNSSQTPEAARTELEKYRTRISGEYRKMIQEGEIVREAITQKMRGKLQNVQHNIPNRWLKGHCWSSTTNAAQWNESWRSRYLPKAMQAITSPQVLVNLLIPPRQIWALWMQKAIDAFQVHAASKGWAAMEISAGEPPEVAAAGTP